MTSGRGPRPRARAPFGRRESTTRREDLIARARNEAQKPWGYESNRSTLLWLSIALTVWVLVALIAAWDNNRTASMIESWQARGFRTVPVGQATIIQLFEFAEVNGIDCHSTAELTSATSGCDQIVEFAGDVNNADSTSAIIFVGQLVALIAVLYLLVSFVHRASRNLRPLKSEGQKFTPGWAVGWMLIPIANFWQPMQVFAEIWRGSDPAAPLGLQLNEHRGRRSPLISFWWLTVVASLLLSPPILVRALANADIQARIDAYNLLMWSDILMVLPAIIGLIVLRGIHNRQEARFAIVGPNLVKAPTPEERAASKGEARPRRPWRR